MRDVVPLRCRTYTHARRFPLVIGKIGGYALPTPLSPAQLVVLLGTGGGLLTTRRIWAHLPGPLDAVVALVVPVALAYATRHVRIEGRSPWRTARGVLGYLLRPRHGVRAGRPVRPPRPHRLHGRVPLVGDRCASPHA